MKEERRGRVDSASTKLENLLFVLPYVVACLITPAVVAPLLFLSLEDELGYTLAIGRVSFGEVLYLALFDFSRHALHGFFDILAEGFFLLCAHEAIEVSCLHEVIIFILSVVKSRHSIAALDMQRKLFCAQIFFVVIVEARVVVARIAICTPLHVAIAVSVCHGCDACIDR